jgi:hypothetical protein
MEALAHPRWEDFDYAYIDDNAFGWFGNGWTENEKNKMINVDYLNEDRIDFPLVEKAMTNGNSHVAESKGPIKIAVQTVEI